MCRIYNKVGESSGKPSTCIVKNVDGEVQRTKKELSDLQKVRIYVHSIKKMIRG